MSSVRAFPDRRRDLWIPLLGALLLTTTFVGLGLAYSTRGGSAERLVTTMFINAIVVVGLQIYIGNTGVLSFGHIGFGAVAGYAFAVFAIAPERKATVIPDAPFGLVDVSMPIPVAAIAAAGVALVVALVVGLGLARSGARSGAVAATVVTLALLFVTHEVALSWVDVTGGDRTGLSFQVGRTLDSNWPVIAVLAGAVILARLFAQSRWGRLAKAAREDDLAARAIGIDPQVQLLVSLLLSVAVVAVAASLRIYDAGNITPKFFFFDYTLLTLVMLIVGGRNSVTGSLLGVVLITIGREVTRQLGSDGASLFGLSLDGSLDLVFREGLSDIFLGAAMLGFMILRPNGLLRDWELDAWLYRRLDSGAAGAEAPDSEAGDPSAASAPEGAAARLVADEITVDFGGFRALDGASIATGQDEIIGLIGPNGAGKTTLVNVITGLVPASSGSFAIDGRSLVGAPAHEIARAGLVRTFQNLRLFSELTVAENVEAAHLVAEQHRSDRRLIGTDRLLREVGLWQLRDRRAGELDYGNSRRLELARAAAMAPTFLLLDEPTSGMSDTESLAMVDQVRAMAALVGAGVLVIDHDLGFITGISDRIYALDQGRVIAEGTPGEIQADSLVQAAYLGSLA